MWAIPRLTSGQEAWAGAEQAKAVRQEAVLRAGAQDYLIKPLDLFTVAEHVAKGSRQNKLTDFSDSVVTRRCKMPSPLN